MTGPVSKYQHKLTTNKKSFFQKGFNIIFNYEKKLDHKKEMSFSLKGEVCTRHGYFFTKSLTYYYGSF